jgi:S-adenosylmethionine hydrolase
MKKLIIIADWAHDSLNRQEVKTAVEGYLKDGTRASISFVYSTPSTIHTAFLMNQIVQTEQRYGDPLNTVIFQNTDPRIHTAEGVRLAKGAEFIIVKLKSGIFLCGPNAGYDFSLVKKEIDLIFHYQGLDQGSQFRSRDLYSRVSAHLMDEMEDEMELEEIPANNIPPLDDHYVGHIDNHGNIKTTITHEELKGTFEYGDTVEITLNEVRKKAQYVDNLFGATPGQLVIYPGSSGTKDDPYLEISVWRHFTEKNPTTGIHAFNSPRPGQKVEIK